MTRQLRQTSIVGLTTFITLAAGRPLAMADVPPALDRVPTTAGVVIAVPNVTKLHDAMKVLQDTFQFNPDEADMAAAMEVFGSAGLKQDGSMAMALIFPERGGDQDDDKAADAPGDDQDADDQDGEGDDEADADDEGGEGEEDDEGMGQDQQPLAITIIPVTDYKAFVGGLKGDPAAPIAELHPGENNIFAKDMGGGFAALSEDSDALGAFAGKGGSLAAYTTMLGKTGARLTESSDVTVVINVQAMGPMIKQGVAAAGQNPMFGGGDPNLAKGLDVLKALGDAVTTDGLSAMVALDVEADGLRVETAANFKEGSPSAAIMQTRGKASSLLANLPASSQGFLFAMAMDTTAPGLKKLLETYASEELKATLAAAETENWMGWLSKSEGAAGVIGTAPIMTGSGFFINTIIFGKSANPAALVAGFQKTTTELNGQTKDSVSITSTYKPGAVTVAGTPVDEWQLVMKVDPNAEGAQQAQMMMPMLFGPKGGPGGYVAPAKNGVVMTMSKNSALMEAGLKAAQGEGANFASDPGVQSVAAKLPEGRAFEAYIGIRDILNMALPLAMMAGMPAIQTEIPTDLPPIGISGTSQDGAMRFSTFVPTSVLKTFTAIFQEVNQGGGGDFEEEEGDDNAGQGNGGGRPRF